MDLNNGIALALSLHVDRWTNLLFTNFPASGAEGELLFAVERASADSDFEVATVFSSLATTADELRNRFGVASINFPATARSVNHLWTFNTGGNQNF